MLCAFACALLSAMLVLSVCNDGASAAQLPDVPGIRLTEAAVPSSVDGAPQPIVVGVPEGYDPATPTPLLVGLHTWSSHYLQMVEPYAAQAAKRGWLLVCPHFRGPNLTSNPNATQAGGSIPAQHDIIDAIAHVRATQNVDASRIYITGGSGGGHMTCLMVCKYPDVFAAAAAWCPITDLRAWHAQQNSYAAHVEAVCGGKPGDSPEVDFEYARRSPRTFITNAANAHLLIGHGDKDYTIFVEQSWETYLRLKPLPAHGVVFQSWSAGHADKAGEGLDWASAFRLSAVPPQRLDIVTDEAKSYFWLHLTPADALTPGRCTAVVVRKGDTIAGDKTVAETTLTLTTEGLARVHVDLRALGLASPRALPEGGAVEQEVLQLHPGAGKTELAIAF